MRQRYESTAWGLNDCMLLSCAVRGLLVSAIDHLELHLCWAAPLKHLPLMQLWQNSAKMAFVPQDSEIPRCFVGLSLGVICGWNVNVAYAEREKLLLSVWCFSRCAPCTPNSRHTCISYMSFFISSVCVVLISTSFFPPAWNMAKMVPLAVLVLLRRKEKRGTFSL